MNFKKNFAIAVAIGGSLILASGGAFAGSGCMMSYSQEHFAKASSVTDSTNPVLAVQENAIDPKWLALLKEREGSTHDLSGPVVIHN